MAKLEYLHTLMSELKGKKQNVVTKERVDSIETLTKTLGEHYREKRERYAVDHPRFYDRDFP